MLGNHQMVHNGQRATSSFRMMITMKTENVTFFKGKQQAVEAISWDLRLRNTHLVDRDSWSPGRFLCAPPSLSVFAENCGPRPSSDHWSPVTCAFAFTLPFIPGCCYFLFAAGMFFRETRSTVMSSRKPSELLTWSFLCHEWPPVVLPM